MKKVAIYVRENEFDVAPINAYHQKKMLEQYCEDNGYDIVNQATAIGDEETSLTKFKQMIEKAKNRDVKKIIICSTDRAKWGDSEFEQITKMANETGIEIEAAED